MSRTTASCSRRHQGIALAIILVLSSVAASGECGSVDRAILALRLTRVLYPNLSGRELSVSFSLGYPSGGPTSFPSDVRTFRITLDKPQWYPPESDSSNVKVVREKALDEPGILPLSLNFDFLDMDSPGREVVCRPISFKDFSESKQMGEARKTINAHPHWTDAEMLKAARDYGMRYGPEKKTDVLRLIPLKALATSYGPLRIKSVKFEIYGNTMKCEGCDFADLRWYIKTEVVGTPRKLQIVVEPFEGKIVSLSEYDPSKWPRPEED